VTEDGTTVRAVQARASFDLQVLAERKAAQGITTAVVVPARDEEADVGAVVTALRAATVPLDGAPVALIDELVVVDGASRDGTVRAAEAAGARVVHQPPEAGPGKGAALQAGVAATSGELIACVDADVHDPDLWLAVGTLAPLLMDPSLRFVKSAAQRAGQGADPVGGGRVTELTVRPLLALLWPPVASVAQPLAGEYAADRALLEALPFERGYGVELGLLLDTLRTCGAGAIGQVDLGVRAHTHQPLEALGRMAAELVLVITDRLSAEGRRLDGADPHALALPRVTRDAAGTLQLDPVMVRRDPLPPLAGATSGTTSGATVSGGRIPARRAP